MNKNMSKNHVGKSGDGLLRFNNPKSYHQHTNSTRELLRSSARDERVLPSSSLGVGVGVAPDLK
jgi:hypothetical protein